MKKIVSKWTLISLVLLAFNQKTSATISVNDTVRFYADKKILQIKPTDLTLHGVNLQLVNRPNFQKFYLSKERSITNCIELLLVIEHKKIGASDYYLRLNAHNYRLTISCQLEFYSKVRNDFMYIGTADGLSRTKGHFDQKSCNSRFFSNPSR